MMPFYNVMSQTAAPNSTPPSAVFESSKDLDQAQKDAKARYEKMMKDPHFSKELNEIRQSTFDKEKIVEKVRDYNSGKSDDLSVILSHKLSEGHLRFVLSSIHFRGNQLELDSLLKILKSEEVSGSAKIATLNVMTPLKSDALTNLAIDAILPLAESSDENPDGLVSLDKMKMKSAALHGLARMGGVKAYKYFLKKFLSCTEKEGRFVILRILRDESKEFSKRIQVDSALVVPEVASEFIEFSNEK